MGGRGLVPGRLVGLLLACLTWLPPAIGWAAPGQAIRLGGSEAQGPATRAVTALYYNPAMLAAMRRSGAHVSFNGGADQQWVRRNLIDAATGEPLSDLADRTYIANPLIGYFVGASLYTDPFAIGLGVYDLSSRFRFHGSDDVRYHLAPDPDFDNEDLPASERIGGCMNAGLNRCAPNGGHVEYLQDFTIAVAWNGGALQVGAAVHMPFFYTRTAVDFDSSLRPTAEGDRICSAREDPTCALRVGFKGYTNWANRDEADSAFDVAISLGLAYTVNDRITLGGRYRSFPVRRRGSMSLTGTGLVCAPDAAGADAGVGEGCSEADTLTASMSQRFPQEIALGASFVIGRSKLWRVDTNLYWLDLCVGGLRPDECADDGAQTLTLVGLEDSVVLPQFPRYRGLQDVFGLDAYGTYRARSNLSVTVAGHVNSPAVRRGATTVAQSDGWRVGVTLGTTFRIRQSDFLVTPGYGIDAYLPRWLDPDEALFDPTAATALEESGLDINAPGADAVLEGRARPTNAGRYFGMVHTLSLAFRWAVRGGRLE